MPTCEQLRDTLNAFDPAVRRDALAAVAAAGFAGVPATRNVNLHFHMKPSILQGPNLLMRPYYPETVTEVGPGPVVPYGKPLTEQLARNFTPYLRKYNSFIMENHGLVTMPRADIYWTLLTVELLEATAPSILLAQSAGALKELDRAAVTNRGNVMRTRSLPLFGVSGVNTALEDLYFA